MWIRFRLLIKVIIIRNQWLKILRCSLWVSSAPFWLCELSWLQDWALRLDVSLNCSTRHSLWFGSGSGCWLWWYTDPTFHFDADSKGCGSMRCGTVSESATLPINITVISNKFSLKKLNRFLCQKAHIRIPDSNKIMCRSERIWIHNSDHTSELRFFYFSVVHWYGTYLWDWCPLLHIFLYCIKSPRFIFLKGTVQRDGSGRN